MSDTLLYITDSEVKFPHQLLLKFFSGNIALEIEKQ